MVQDKYISEPERSTAIMGDFDVVVAGGGIAGVAAAVAAARHGASVCLLEKEYALGGLATLGLVVGYLPICDGRGSIVSTGLAEEMLHLSTKDGNSSVPDCWKPGGDVEDRNNHRCFVEYNAASMILEMESFVRDEGVTLLYDVRVVDVKNDNGKVDAVFVETKNGRKSITCRAVVDASGDADVCWLAGEETVSLNTNSASGWYFSTSATGNAIHKLFKPFDPEAKILPPGTDRGYYGDSAEEVTAHIFESRQMIRDHIAERRMQKNDPTVIPFLIPTFPGFRMTRRLKAEIEMEAADRVEHYDSVGLIANWREPGPIYSVPLRSLQGMKNRNIFAAGRCMSATGIGWDQTRVIPACAVTGQAAGVAAALCRESDKIEVSTVQRCLLEQGVTIWLNQVEHSSTRETESAKKPEGEALPTA